MDKCGKVFCSAPRLLCGFLNRIHFVPLVVDVNLEV
jgi:hypothetical protein